jgi:hypothetical protein
MKIPGASLRSFTQPLSTQNTQSSRPETVNLRWGDTHAISEDVAMDSKEFIMKDSVGHALHAIPPSADFLSEVGFSSSSHMNQPLTSAMSRISRLKQTTSLEGRGVGGESVVRVTDKESCKRRPDSPLKPSFSSTVRSLRSMSPEYDMPTLGEAGTALSHNGAKLDSSPLELGGRASSQVVRFDNSVSTFGSTLRMSQLASESRPGPAEPRSDFSLVRPPTGAPHTMMRARGKLGEAKMGHNSNHPIHCPDPNDLRQDTHRALASSSRLSMRGDLEPAPGSSYSNYPGSNANASANLSFGSQAHHSQSNPSVVEDYTSSIEESFAVDSLFSKPRGRRARMGSRLAPSNDGVADITVPRDFRGLDDRPPTHYSTVKDDDSEGLNFADYKNGGVNGVGDVPYSSTALSSSSFPCEASRGEILKPDPGLLTSTFTSEGVGPARGNGRRRDNAHARPRVQFDPELMGGPISSSRMPC